MSFSFNAFYFFLFKFGLVDNKDFDFKGKQVRFLVFFKRSIWTFFMFQEWVKSISWMKNNAPPESQFINQQKNSPSSCPHSETLVSRLS